MRIQHQNSGVPQPLPASRPGTPRLSAQVAQDLVLLGQIKTQENIIRLSHGVPWATALATATGVYYLANHSMKVAGIMGLPAGLLLGAGLAEYLSNQASFKISEAQAQLSSPDATGKPPS